MPKYDDIKNIKAMLHRAQDVDTDNREQAREAFNFVHKRDGQWEPDIATRFRGRPRYTFDKVGPIVDQIAGEIDRADFDIRVRPAGGDATKKTASVYDGIVRDIEARSDAQIVYSSAARSMVEGGIGGWMVKQDWADDDSFEQDLMIVPIGNFEDRVYFDENAERQDMADANHVFVLTLMGKQEYEERWPDGSGASVSTDQRDNVYYHKKDGVVVGQVWYKKPATKELVLFSDNSVREAGEDLDSVMDELAEQGITEVKRRKRKTHKIYTRIFDGKEFLTSEQETVFHAVPVVPVYGNFAIREGKVIWRGHVDRLIDPQRVYNYTRSREVEEVALSPRAKWWMTKKQAQEHTRSLATLNTNADPIQLYTNDPEVPGPPIQNGGAQINQGLINAGQSSKSDLADASGVFGINQGRTEEGPMSGVAIQALQNKGDNATIKYFTAMEIGITATARLLVKAIPKVYDTNRQIRILNEDGSYEVTSVNDRVYDQDSGKWAVVNDLRKGKYDVTCDVGPAFQNRQQEAVKALTEAMSAMPIIGEIGGDVLLKNINSPGVDVVAERLRNQMVQSGLIPQSQMTDEEIAQIQQAMMQAQMQPQEPTPEDKLAEAEIARVQAETADVVSKSQERSDKLQIQYLDQQRKAIEAQEKSDLEQMKLIMQQQARAMEEQQAMVKANMEGYQMVVQALNSQADTLKKLRDAIGADAVISPNAAEAYSQQAEMVTETQERIDPSPEQFDNNGMES